MPLSLKPWRMCFLLCHVSTHVPYPLPSLPLPSPSFPRQDIKFAVHAHPTLSEVLEELYRSAKASESMPLQCMHTVLLHSCSP